ncbi:MAG: IS4 family transposase [Bacteroidia bacterium]|nr:IS4 family transposase [Bacteroidia bacterium]
MFFLIAIVKCQTVSFSRLATIFNGRVQPGSNLRRIQRFFAQFDFNERMFGKLIFALLPIEPPYRLSLDRTNWKFGKTDINILMISVCYYGVAIPLLWTMLPKRGNSNQKERIALLERYISLFGIMSIESILADREFIGSTWVKHLIGEKIAFYIRIKENMWMESKPGTFVRAFSFFKDLKFNTALSLKKPVKINDNKTYLSGLKILNKHRNIEYVIIASDYYDEHALIMYKDRWQIETMFKALKSSGFNIEDTHLSDLNRISKMLSLVCIAFIWAYYVGIYRDKNIEPIKIKKHGRRQYSFFTYGLRFIERALVCSVAADIVIILKILSCT